MSNLLLPGESFFPGSGVKMSTFKDWPAKSFSSNGSSPTFASNNKQN